MNLQTWEATSAAGAMTRAPMALHGVLFRPLYGPIDVGGTAARFPTAAEEFWLLALPQTSPGLLPADPKEAAATSAAILELRRLSGLTWEQLAALFKVARRSLHFWASGKPVNAPNEERLRRVLAVLRRADRGTAAGNHALLFEDREGVVPYDLLARGEYEAFERLVTTGPGRRDVSVAPLSRSVREARMPQRPDELVDALQDRVHVEAGKARPGRAVKVGRARK